VTREDKFEQRLATWLEEGPMGSPDRPVRDAIAHAHAHPRRRLTVAGLWRAAMNQIRLTEVTDKDGRDRSFIAVVAGVAVVAVVAVVVLGSGLLSPRDGPSSVAAPVGVATASPETQTATVAPSVAATVPAEPSATPADVRGGFSVADLAGTWTGELVTPWTGPDWESDPSKDTTSRLSLEIGACTLGASCGTWKAATDDVAGTGKPMACEGTLTYTGPFEDRAAFAFSESVTPSGVTANCAPSTLVLTPFSGGTRAAVEERQDGVSASWGLVTRSSTP
jgi:hypothetical protein